MHERVAIVPPFGPVGEEEAITAVATCIWKKRSARSVHVYAFVPNEAVRADEAFEASREQRDEIGGERRLLQLSDP